MGGLQKSLQSAHEKIELVPDDELQPQPHHAGADHDPDGGEFPPAQHKQRRDKQQGRNPVQIRGVERGRRAVPQRRYQNGNARRGDHRNHRRAQSAQHALHHRQGAVAVVDPGQGQHDDAGGKDAADGGDDGARISTVTLFSEFFQKL